MPILLNIQWHKPFLTSLVCHEASITKMAKVLCMPLTLLGLYRISQGSEVDSELISGEAESETEIRVEIIAETRSAEIQ